MNTLDQIIGISSRYSLKTINSNLYQTIPFNSSGNTTPLATLTSGGTWTPGLIFAPYIPMQLDSFDLREWKIIMLKKERKEKLKKLGYENFKKK